MGEALGSSALGQTATSRAFGATIELGAPDQGLCLVVGRGGLDATVEAVGGHVVARLSAGRVLALVTWSGLRALWAHPDVTTAGPVSLDPERFARFCVLTGVDGTGPDDERTTAPARAQEG